MDQVKYVEQSLKNLKGYGLLMQGYLPHNLIGSFSNTLTKMKFMIGYSKKCWTSSSYTFLKCGKYPNEMRIR